jgi:hypothetical protein
VNSTIIDVALVAVLEDGVKSPMNKLAAVSALTYDEDDDDIVADIVAYGVKSHLVVGRLA